MAHLQTTTKKEYVPAHSFQFKFTSKIMLIADDQKSHNRIKRIEIWKRYSKE